MKSWFVDRGWSMRRMILEKKIFRRLLFDQELNMKVMEAVKPRVKVKEKTP